MRTPLEHSNQNAKLNKVTVRARGNKHSPKQSKSRTRENLSTGDLQDSVVPLLSIEGLLQVVKLVEDMKNADNLLTES